METYKNAKDELERFRERALELQKAVRQAERDIKQAVHFIQIGRNTARVIDFLQERLGAQLANMYELGRVRAAIDHWDTRVRSWDRHRDAPHTAEEWEQGTPDAHEDHLDWLEPILREPDAWTEPQRDEREPEDYSDARG